MPTLRLIYLPEHQYHDEMQNDVIMHAGHHDGAYDEMSLLTHSRPPF